ncbi:MAG: hypothetical protein KKD01_20210 [Proteobacteria bacterium]|nr:hypothetical protein [Pseudomonadota bacterium]
MDLQKMSIQELKALAFDLDQQGKAINQNYQAVLQVLGKKIQDEKAVPVPVEEKSDV